MCQKVQEGKRRHKHEISALCTKNNVKICKRVVVSPLSASLCLKLSVVIVDDICELLKLWHARWEDKFER